MKTATTFAILALVLVSAGARAFAQAPAQTASQFYVAYRVVFDKAKTVDEIKPYHSKAVRAQMDATPAAQRGQMFEMMKMMGTMTGVKVVKETGTATRAVLSVEGLDSDKKKATGEVTIIKEDGAWKIDKEEWKS